MDYEYRVIPAPKRLKRIKGVSSTGDLFAATLTDCINAEARDGWEYVRSEQLAAEEPGGWFRRPRMVEETVMIFRRRRQAAAPEPEAGEPAGHRAPQAGAGLRARIPAGQSRAEESRDERLLRPPAQGGPAPPLLRPVPRHTPNEKS